MTTLEPWQEQLDRIHDLLVPMDTKEAEIFATVHAAWNNLIIDGIDTTDTNILYEAQRKLASLIK